MKSWTEKIDSRWKRVVVTALVLLVGSVLPSPLRRHPEFSRIGPDKLLHALGHACLTVTLADALATDGLDVGRAGVVAVVCSFVHGFVIGLLQRRVPGRVPERADLVAGLLGSVVGALGWWSVFDARMASSARVTHQSTCTDARRN